MQEIDATANEFQSTLLRATKELDSSRIKAANERKEIVSVENSVTRCSDKSPNLVTQVQNVSKNQIQETETNSSLKKNNSIEYYNKAEKIIVETELAQNLLGKSTKGNKSVHRFKEVAPAKLQDKNCTTGLQRDNSKELSATNYQRQHICMNCNKGFTRKRTLRDHMEIVHLKIMVECPICKKKLCKPLLRMHMNVVHTPRVHNYNTETDKTDKINVETEFAQNLLGKKTKSIKSVPHFKEVAPRKLQDKNCTKGLQKDNSKELAATNFQSQNTCLNCNTGFTRSRALRDHNEIVHLKIMVECPICKKKSYKPRLRRHMNMVHKGKPKKAYCEICRTTFKETNTFESHVHVKNENKTEIKYKCLTCGKISSDYRNWKRHVRCVHNGEKKFKCQICSKNFGAKAHLNMHITTIHDGSKPFLCEICSISFGHIHNLRAHIKSVHENIRPFACNSCPYQSSFKKNLEYHTDNYHNKLRKHQCSECQKSFAQRASLVAHQNLVHINLQSQVCKMCNDKFDTKVKLKAHHLKMHKDQLDENRSKKDQKFSCKQCNAIYLSRSALSRHVKVNGCE